MISGGEGIDRRQYGDRRVMDEIRNLAKPLGNQTDVWLNLE